METHFKFSPQKSNSLSMAASSSNSDPPFSPETQTRNWLDLPHDVMSTIFLKLGPIEIITSVQLVCSLWRKICKDPLMWRKIDLNNLGDIHDMNYDLERMCRHAIDRSCGQLVDINVEYFGTDDLLKYITDSTCNLRHLRLACCYGISDEGLNDVVAKLPMLEELDSSLCQLSKDSLEVVGRFCPLLKSCKFNSLVFRRLQIECDDEAFAIAETMPGLRHLQLIGNKLTNDGLRAILDKCPHLEYLDLRRCFNVNLGGSLGKRCAELIKDLRLPLDPTDDYPFQTEAEDDGYGSFDEEYPSGISDNSLFSFDDYQYYDSGGSEYSSGAVNELLVETP